MIDQKDLTEGVADYYSATGPSGIGDRNTRMATAGLVDLGSLDVETIQSLAADVAKQVIIHHHFGLGNPDKDPSALTQEELGKLLHSLESNEVSVLMDHMGTVRPTDTVLDAGSGRGGTAFMISDRFGCKVDGATIAPYQAHFAQRLARASQRTGVNFLLMNMLRLGFEGGSFDHVVQNETDMYIVDLEALYTEFARVLKPSGRFTFATWCRNSTHPNNTLYAAPIDNNYSSKMHGHREYKEALLVAGFTDIVVHDLTEEALPYWKIRNEWDQRSGVEQHYIRGYEEDGLKYLIVSAQKD